MIRCERFHHHATFLKECLDKNIIPKGLILDKTVNIMVGQSKEERDLVNYQVKEILTDSLCKIMQVLVEYYEKAIVDKHCAFTALNDELAAVELTVEESEEVDAYDEKIHTKQDTLRTKLENRRAAKVQKLLNPEPEAGPSRTNKGTRKPQQTKDKENNKKGKNKK